MRDGSNGSEEAVGGEPNADGGSDADGRHRELTAGLAVPEMDCPSCAGKVDNALGRLDGVTEAALNPTAGTATVTYDPDVVDEDDVVAAIEGAGYEVTGGRSTGGEDGDAGGADGTDDAGSGGVAVAPPAEVWTTPRAKKTWLGAALVVAGLLFEFVLTGRNPAVASVLGAPLSLADVLFIGAVAASGIPVVRGGYYSARNRSLDIDLLMGTAIIAATGIGYFVEAATLAVLFSVAELLEDYAMDRARDSLRELMELSPDEATVRREGEESTVPADEVAVGETVVVRPGEKVPLDGTVIEGESAVDESPITGESVPVDKAPGDEVFAGAINEEGYLEIEVTSTAGDSTLARIIELVQGAQAEKTETERFVDRFAAGHRGAGDRRPRGVPVRLRGGLGDVVRPGAHAAGDRVPLRVRHLDARLGRLRDHERGEERRPDQGRQPPRGDGWCRRRRARQDRDAHQGRTGRHRPAPARRRRRGEAVAARGGAGAAERTPDRRGGPRPR
jgi:Cd2+/Zn2+-exporting ATPase